MNARRRETLRRHPFLHDGLSRRCRRIGGETKDNFCRKRPERLSKRQGPDLGPKATTQSLRWSDQIEIRCLGVLPQPSEYVVEFGGWFDFGTLASNNHMYDCNGKYWQCLAAANFP